MPESNSEFPARSRLMYLRKDHKLNDKKTRIHMRQNFNTTPSIILVKLFSVFCFYAHSCAQYHDENHHYNMAFEKKNCHNFIVP